jgi:hypothetical protein
VFVYAARFLKLFGPAGFDAALVVLGCGFAAVSVHARLSDPFVWQLGEFLATLGFAALLVVLGCLDRLLPRRAPTSPADPGSRTQGDGRPTPRGSSRSLIPQRRRG